MVVLLESNKKHESEVWIKEHVYELISLRTKGGDTILHKVFYICLDCFPIESFVRMFVEECKMDVNVQNNWRATPLHCLSSMIMCEQIYPTEDVMRVAELLISNGSHMDAVDVDGLEASQYFSRRCPKWSFNFSLKCLAARAILKHGYEQYVPKNMIPFIESHKPGDL